MNKPAALGCINATCAGQIMWNGKTYSIKSTTPAALGLFVDGENVPVGQRIIVADRYGVESWQVVAHGQKVGNVKSVR